MQRSSSAILEKSNQLSKRVRSSVVDHLTFNPMVECSSLIGDTSTLITSKMVVRWCLRAESAPRTTQR